MVAISSPNMSSVRRSLNERGGLYTTGPIVAALFFHECAAFAMLVCVKALLYYGAPINALECKILPRLHHGTKINTLDG